MNIGKVVLGTMAGLAIGAIAGILFAPEKGSKIRKQISDKGEYYVDKIQSKFDGVVESVTERFDSTKKNAENLVEKGKAKYDEAKRDVRNPSAFTG